MRRRERDGERERREMREDRRHQEIAAIVSLDEDARRK